MNNFVKIVLIFILIESCSLHKTSKFWTKQEIVKEKQELIEKEYKTVTELFKKEENLSFELNANLKISLYSKAIDKSFLNNFDNNNGRVNFNGDLQRLSKYKFSKIKNFHQYDPKISFYNNDIIFFDNKGSILRFNKIIILKLKKNKIQYYFLLIIRKP